MSWASASPLWTVGLSGLIAFAVTFFLTPVVRSVAIRLGWIAKPVEHRWGRRIVARLGGVAMFVGFIAALAVQIPHDPSLLGFAGGIILVFILGFVDDLRRMPPYAKLVAQLLIGCLVVTGGIRIELIRSPWLSIPLSVLWFVFVMNAFNLLDNMDGLAAGVGAIAAGFCAFHAIGLGQWTMAAVAVSVSGICLGFLRYNFPPAKIFMGDSGSHLLGLSLAAIALMGSWRHSTQLLSVLAIPTLILAVPIFDTCFVTLQRLTHHLHPFTGGTDHVSHRLAILGLSTRQTVLALYGVSAGLGLLSIVSATMKPIGALAVWLSVVTALLVFGRYLSNVTVYRLEPTPPNEEPGIDGPSRTLIETMLLHKRRLLEILVDFCVISSVYVFAHLLRFEGTLTWKVQELIVRSLPIVLLIKLTCFAGCGLYRGVWRYAGLSDVAALFKASTLGSVATALALLYLWRFEGYSRAVLIIDWMLTFLAVGGSRVVERLLDEWIRASSGARLTTLIIGAGDTGERVLRYLKYEGRQARRVIGFLDDDVRKQGTSIHGCSVLGGRSRLADILAQANVQEVLVAIGDPPGELLQHVRLCCEPLGVTWKAVTAGVMDAA
jgi:UDP-GlcNAc:undecaprenyl-phosphate GlcNAc-1-phosphate transferase